MSNKIKPWQKRKPKQHGEKDRKRPPLRDGQRDPRRMADGRISTGDMFLDNALAYADETSG